MPDQMVSALLAGEPPFDEVDAVFVSHVHGDHFSALGMAALLTRRPAVKLYAPAQAVTAMAALTDIDALRSRSRHTRCRSVV